MKTLYTSLTIALMSLAPVAAMAADAPHDKMGHWKEADTNNDGVISKQEYQASQDKRFKDIDTSGDGNISQDEMQAHRAKMKEHFQQMREHHKAN